MNLFDIFASGCDVFRLRTKVGPQRGEGPPGTKMAGEGGVKVCVGLSFIKVKRRVHLKYDYFVLRVPFVTSRKPHVPNPYI